MKEGKEGRGRCAGSVAVSKLALVPVGDVLCCAVLCGLCKRDGANNEPHCV